VSDKKWYETMIGNTVCCTRKSPTRANVQRNKKSRRVFGSHLLAKTVLQMFMLVHGYESKVWLVASNDAFACIAMSVSVQRRSVCLRRASVRSSTHRGSSSSREIQIFRERQAQREAEKKEKLFNEASEGRDGRDGRN